MHVARIFKTGLIYFSLVFGAGFMLGAIRVPFLVPRLGERYAVLMEMPVMFIVVLFSARYISKRFLVHTTVYARAGVGLAALALMLTAEALPAVVIQDRSLTEYIANRDPICGTLYMIVLVLFALMPYIMGRMSRGHDSAAPNALGVPPALPGWQ